MQPDIEIYVKNLSLDQLLSWLNAQFEHVESNKLEAANLEKGHAVSFYVSSKEHDIEVFLNPHASGKSFASIWFKSEHTQWKDDLECAESFLLAFDNEVRCSEMSWTDDEVEHSEKWWKLTRESRELISWG